MTINNLATLEPNPNLISSLVKSSRLNHRGPYFSPWNGAIFFKCKDFLINDCQTIRKQTNMYTHWARRHTRRAWIDICAYIIRSTTTTRRKMHMPNVWIGVSYLLFESGFHGLCQFGHILGEFDFQVAPFLHVGHNVFGVFGPEFGPVQGHFDALFQLQKDGVHLDARQVLLRRRGRLVRLLLVAGRAWKDDGRHRVRFAGRRCAWVGQQGAVLGIRRDVLARLGFTRHGRAGQRNVAVQIAH